MKISKPDFIFVVFFFFFWKIRKKYLNILSAENLTQYTKQANDYNILWYIFYNLYELFNFISISSVERLPNITIRQNIFHFLWDHCA